MGIKTYDKQQARLIIQARLHLLADEEYVLSASAVLQNLAKVLAGLRTEGTFKNILSYQASQKWREIDVSPLEREFKDIIFDYVPVDAQAPFPDASYDVVLVPLYGFNDEGFRLGHGSGWYDSFLVTQPGILKVGVGLEANRVDFTVEPHDIPMDMIVTEYEAQKVQST